MWNRSIWVLALGISVVISCGGNETSPQDQPPETNEPEPSVSADASTWHQDIKPIFDAYCNNCHTEDGIAPFALEQLDDVKVVAGLIANSVQSRTMPPFLAAPAARPLQYDVSLSDTQIEAIVSWIEEGMPEGNAEEPGPSIDLPISTLSRVDLTLGMPEPYTPTLMPDEYRCIVLDWPETQATYITGYDFKPGNLAINHHAAIFLIDAPFVEVVDAADGADNKGIGYPCFGSPAPPGNEGIPNKLIAAWTPGGGGVNFPQGTGIRVEPGARVILQMHYSTLEAAGESDQTTLDLRLDESVEKNAGNLPWLDIGWPTNPETMMIPAHADSVAHEHVADPTQSPLLGEFAPGVDPTQGLVLHGLLPHMHKLGKAFWVQVERSDGTQERIFTIENWDFDWQGYYLFQEPVVVMPGDQLRMHCEFDNSPAKQPFLNGEKREPEDVVWGEGTYDEMCTASIYINGVAEASTDCPGSTPAQEGQFEVTFDAPATVRDHANLEGELRGPVSGSIYRDEDVSFTGPMDGAEPVASFSFDEIDLRNGPSGPHIIDAVLPAGEYQFLGYMDTDGNAEAQGGPDLHDPIMIPSRASTLQCAKESVTINFPLLLPQL